MLSASGAPAAAQTATTSTDKTVASPGSNGDIKVHSGEYNGTEHDAFNTPHICSPLHLHGFNFDVTPGGFWAIYGWPPEFGAKDKKVTGSWPAGPEWESPKIELEPGHYKLYWQEGTTSPSWPANVDNTLGGLKFKVFWVQCNEAVNEASITIGPSAVNDIGKGQTSHTFNVAVTGTAALTNVAITPTVDTTIASSTCATPVTSGNTSNCSFTISSSSPAGPFTAGASATGTTGSTAFSIATDNTGLNSGTATKTFACLTHNLTFNVTGAGKSQAAYTNFTGGTWKVTAHYSTDGSTNLSNSLDLGTPVDQDSNATTLGDLTFSATASIATPATPYTANVRWSFTIDQGTTNIFDSGLIGNAALVLGNTGNCSGSLTGISPKSTITFFKVQDGTGAGYPNTSPDNVLFAPNTVGFLSGWTINATSSVNELVSATTGLDGSITATLDGLFSWNICEAQQDGYVETYPGQNSCIALAKNAVDQTIVFANFKTVNLSVTKTANTAFTRTFHWNVSKSVDNSRINTSGSATANYTVNVSHDAGTDSDFVVSGSITVTNTNPIAVPVNVTDSLDGGTNCTYAPNATPTVPAFGSSTVTYSCSFPTTKPSATSNTGTATWTAAGQLAGTAGTASNATPVAITWGAPSTIVNGSVTVSDTLQGALGTVSYSDVSPATFRYSLVFNDPAGTCTTHNNTASISGLTVTAGSTTSDSKSVQVCVGANLTVSKGATPAFSRKYNWSIGKSPLFTHVDQYLGTYTKTFTITATQTGNTDSAFAVSGTIRVSNPNDWESITANVTDAIDNGGTCTVTGGAGVVVPAGQYVDLGYSCTFSATNLASASGTNVATATWDATAASTPAGSNTGSATYAFNNTPTSRTNQTVTVTDTLGTTNTLGTASGTDSPAYTVATFNDTRTVNGPTSNCVNYTNTATIVETSQTATARIEICVGATRTQGFWSTHTTYTNAKWANVLAGIGGQPLSCQPINVSTTKGASTLMGAFWSGISNKSTGKTRTALEQARMQLVQQLAAALLNKYGLLNNTGDAQIAAGIAAYCGTDTAAILAAASGLDKWNNAGDATAIPAAANPELQGNSTQKASQDQANLIYWDSTTH